MHSIDEPNDNPYVGEPRWTAVAQIGELPVGSQSMVRVGGRAVALFRPESGEVYAIDNSCPHEGYPLAKGRVQGHVLTCCWHNYKFDLRNGQCLQGDEDVRWYSARIRAEQIEIDLRPEPLERSWSRHTEALREGLYERRMGQVARCLVRLHQAEMPLHDIVWEAVRFDCARGEYGCDHVLALAQDLLRLAEGRSGEELIATLMPVFELAAETSVRRPLRASPCSSRLEGHLRRVGSDLAALVEGERLAEAEALLSGALAAGATREMVEAWFLKLCTDHFLGFGHGLIFCVKGFDFLEHVGWGRAPDVLPGLLIRLGSQTREDLLPEWSWFRRELSRYEPEFGDWMLAQDKPQKPEDPVRLYSSWVDGSRTDALAGLAAALERGTDLGHLVDILSAAASERMLRFDVAHDRDPSVQEGWLDVTHLLTFVNALRHACARYREPGILRLFFYAVRFVNNARALDRAADPEPHVPAQSEKLAPATAGFDGAPGGEVQALVEAIEYRNAEGALDRCRSYLGRGGSIHELVEALVPLVLSDRYTRPIVFTHVIKTAMAAFEECTAHHTPRFALKPLWAAVRFLASPIQERPSRRLVHEAHRFVVEGRVPRTLA